MKGLVAVPPLAASVAPPTMRGKRGAGQAYRIPRISRVVADLNHAEAFYRDALAFRTIQHRAIDSATRRALGAGDAEEIVMRLGKQGFCQRSCH